MPESQVVTVMREHKAALLRGEAAQMREMARRWVAVERRLNGNINALAEQMARLKRDGSTVTNDIIFSSEHYRALLPQLMDELNTYTDFTGDLITDQQKRLIRLGIAHGEQAIRTQIGAGFSRLPTEAVENMVALSSGGSPLRSLLSATWPDSIDGLTQALVNGIALGYNPRRVAREMAVGTERSLNRMMVIARTEQLRSYRAASLASYKASSVVTGYARLCAHDSRVCPACLADEGHVYTLDEEMPEHPQGRCVAVPIIKDVPTPTWKQGEEWFQEQDVTTQVSILGKGRWDAWTTGKLAFNDMKTVVPNPIWGPSLQTTPLGKLGRGGV